MSRRAVGSRWVVALLVTAAVGALVIAVIAAGVIHATQMRGGGSCDRPNLPVVPAKPRADQPTGGPVLPKPERSDDYWTPERMRRARPA